jgi:hypothetical protein
MSLKMILMRNQKRRNFIWHTTPLTGSHCGDWFTIITTSVNLFHIHMGMSNFKLSIDPLDFDRKCDGSLPLKEMITPNPDLIKLFKDIDRSKCRVWALTNAYITVRRVRLMISDCFTDRFIPSMRSVCLKYYS